MLNLQNKVKRFMTEYWDLSILAWQELKSAGLRSLIFAVMRHFKNQKEVLIAQCKMINNFEPGLVTIGIITINKLDLIKPCVESIQKSVSDKYQIEIVIGDTGSKEKQVWDYYMDACKRWGNIKVVEVGKYHFGRNYNYLFSYFAKGEYLILLNNDTVVKGKWLDNLIDPLEDKRIGAVGGKLLYQDGAIQHAGLEFKDGNASAVYARKAKDIPEANFKAFVPAVTFACVAMRHDVYNRFKLNEDYREEAQDTDFCLRLGEAGFKVLYNPRVEICHLECSTRNWKKGESDRLHLQREWGKRIREIIAVDRQRIQFDPDEYKGSILILRDDGIGDLLMGINAFKKLREKFPDKKLLLGTYERNVEMMDAFGIFNEIFAIPNTHKYAPLPIPKDAKLYDLRDLEMDFQVMYGRPLETNKVHRHEVFSRILGLGEPEFELVPMPDFPKARANVLEMLNKKGVGAGQNFVVFNLTASNPARSWWEPYYPELIQAIEEMGLVPLILGTENSHYYKGKNIVNLVGETETTCEFIEAVKLGKYVISTDSSAYHIAALSGIPFLAIFSGGIKPEARLNHYEKYEFAEPPDNLTCYPCWDEGCTDPLIRWKKDPCRLLIKPEEIINKFKMLVEKYPM